MQAAVESAFPQLTTLGDLEMEDLVQAKGV